MSDLTWLRRRIWIAVALPLAGGCGSATEPAAPPPTPFDAAVATAVPTPAHDAAPPPVHDAAPPPRDAAVARATAYARSDASIDPRTVWRSERYRGCGQRWCAPSDIATDWATGPTADDGCPSAVVVPVLAASARSHDANAPAAYIGYRNKDAACCYIWHGTICEGRPFLDGDAAQVAALVPAAGGASAVAALWLAAALDEHASIASFARATLELLAVGAPPSLIAGCQQAGLDELFHAQGCFAMAARHGRVAEPGPLAALAPRGGGLAAVARDTFLEGCVGESLGAAIAAAHHHDAVDPDERALLARITDDEARHAELAWQTVSWALRRDPGVASTLRAAADHARATALDDATSAAVWRDVIDPTLDALLAAA